jgi:glycolate oxidase iron-sulfur subunit
MEDFTESGAEKILTSCPGCVLQLNEGTIRYANKLKVQHIADFVAEHFITEEDRKVYSELWEKVEL